MEKVLVLVLCAGDSHTYVQPSGGWWQLSSLEICALITSFYDWRGFTIFHGDCNKLLLPNKYFTTLLPHKTQSTIMPYNNNDNIWISRSSALTNSHIAVETLGSSYQDSDGSSSYPWLWQWEWGAEPDYSYPTKKRAEKKEKKSTRDLSALLCQLKCIQLEKSRKSYNFEWFNIGFKWPASLQR